MANDDHIAQLMKGVDAWNAWRDENPEILPNLREADLTGVDLSGMDREKLIYAAEIRRTERVGAAKAANLRGADLSDAHLCRADLSGADLTEAKLNVALLLEATLIGADLSRANLCGARLAGADLCRADLSGADLTEAKLNVALLSEAILFEATLIGADLSRANLCGANLTGANLSGANLSGADLSLTNLVETDLTDADLTSCRVYGASAWNLKLDGAKQQNLVITKAGPAITVDNIEVAQFIYLLLHNQKIRDVIDTITSKAVLILGRFTDERKAVLDALRDELRNRDLLPILFDFAISASRDVTETIKTLASLARFVIADVTDATEVRVELHNIVPDFTSLPVQLILLRGHSEFVSLSHLTKFPWVLPIFEYDDEKHLLASLDKSVVGPAEDMTRKLRT
jgi:uncharacterized protein YjbI with pentapeptide repeats